MAELYKMTATQIVNLLKAGDVCPFDWLDALVQRNIAVNAKINSLLTRCFDRPAPMPWY